VAARFKAQRDKAASGGLEQKAAVLPHQARGQIHGDPSRGFRLLDWARRGPRKERCAVLDLRRNRELAISLSASAHSADPDPS
jgi:hypothetical protein